MVPILVLEAPAEEHRGPFVRSAGAALAAHGGTLAPSVGGALVATFPDGERALACAEEIHAHETDDGRTRLVLHLALPEEIEKAARRAAECLAVLPSGALLLSDELKARLPSLLQRRFSRRMLAGGILPGWTYEEISVPRVASAARPLEELRDALAGWARGWRASDVGGALHRSGRRLGSFMGQVFREAMDAVERSVGPAPALGAFVESLAAAGRPLSIDELADLHHLTRRRTRKLLHRALRDARVREVDEGRFIALTDAEREEVLFERERSAFAGHVTTYAAVNAGLVAINLVTTGGDPFWAIFPIAGWGIGLAAHAHRYLAARRRHRAAQERRPPATPPPPEASWSPPWREIALAARALLAEIAVHLGPGDDEEQAARRREVLAEYDRTVAQLAGQGTRLDAILGRFSRADLEAELEKTRAEVDASPEDALASGHHDRASLLERQLGVLRALERRRDAMLVKLKNVRTSLDTLSLELSQEALQSEEARADALIERGAREIAQYRGWMDEAAAEVERLLRE